MPLREAVPVGRPYRPSRVESRTGVRAPASRGVDPEREDSGRGNGTTSRPPQLMQNARNHLERAGALTNAFLLGFDGPDLYPLSVVCAFPTRLAEVTVAFCRPSAEAQE